MTTAATAKKIQGSCKFRGLFGKTLCCHVESAPDRCGGAWIIRGSLVPVQAIRDNVMAGCTARQIAREIFDLDLDTVRWILAFAAR